MTISDQIIAAAITSTRSFDKANICLNYCNKERPSIEYAGRTWRSLKEEVDQKQKKLNENL